eukprot:TRINITY_DN28318_c0_g1_i1.p1 TRINITY_DN28318_c0_g1~~TRINITY_DN28318_c0_g1_i1.p1  ORF type:complete len:357 (+),score=62.48 TRINITY_DN28318_c0_g1_i1:90-1160(+)
MMNRHRKDNVGKVAQKLRILAEKSMMISTHSHSLDLTRMNNLQIRDKKGEIRYTFDGAGAYCCRMCINLRYGEAHHCKQCIPSYDVCPKCFAKQRAEDSKNEGDCDIVTQQKRKQSTAVLQHVDTELDAISSEEASIEPISTGSIMKAAEAGEFSDLLEILFPAQKKEDLTAEAQGQAPVSINFGSIDADTGKTLLHHAAGHGNGRVVLGLLMRMPKERIDLQDQNGLTALMIASVKGHTEVVDELLYGHVNTDLRCNQGYTALMLAACYGWPDIVSRLIFSGALVNEQSPQGRTALAMAALNGRSSCVHRLTQYEHLDRSLVDSEGYSPLLLAASRGHQDVINLFTDEERSVLLW